MEKILNDSEKIRRAEQIYARRRGIELEQNEEKEKNNTYKFLFRVILLINIIISILCVQNKDFIFNKEFIQQFGIYSGKINDKVNYFINNIKNDGTDIKENENQENSIEPKKTEDTSSNVSVSTNSYEIVEKQAQISKEETISQKIKNSYSFIKPIEGTVTSFFGDRESKYQNVTGNHKGIDVGAVTGTIIKSAIEGTVCLVSDKGDYRKSHQN